VDLTSVCLSPAAWGGLKPSLDAPGNFTGGPLYGFRSGGILYVQLAAPGGYPWWSEERSPLDLDARYSLGWSDCLRTMTGDDLGWIGQWLMYPDRNFPSIAVDHNWMLQGILTRLIDHEFPLLVMGYHDGARSVRAHRFEYGSLEIVPLSLTSEWLTIEP